MCNGHGEGRYRIVTVSYTNTFHPVNQLKILEAKHLLQCHLTIRLNTVGTIVKPYIHEYMVKTFSK